MFRYPCRSRKYTLNRNWSQTCSIWTVQHREEATHMHQHSNRPPNSQKHSEFCLRETRSDIGRQYHGKCLHSPITIGLPLDADNYFNNHCQLWHRYDIRPAGPLFFDLEMRHYRRREFTFAEESSTHQPLNLCVVRLIACGAIG